MPPPSPAARGAHTEHRHLKTCVFRGRQLLPPILHLIIRKSCARPSLTLGCVEPSPAPCAARQLFAHSGSSAISSSTPQKSLPTPSITWPPTRRTHIRHRTNLRFPRPSQSLQRKAPSFECLDSRFWNRPNSRRSV